MFGERQNALIDRNTNINPKRQRSPLPNAAPKHTHPIQYQNNQNCGRKFLDAIMTTARVELFLPKVEIVAALDHVNELYVIVAGALSEMG